MGNLCGERGCAELGYEWLKMIGEILKNSGIAVMEAYPPGDMLHLTEPAAVIELRTLNSAEGEALFGIQVLSPRNLGGWKCQAAAADAASALYHAELNCSSGKMEYLTRMDCFCILVVAKIPVCCENGKWVKGHPWKISIENQSVPYASRFCAEQHQQRRMVGAVCQSDPVGVTPCGNTGWNIRLVQTIPWGKNLPVLPVEPFSLTVHRGSQRYVYRDCCWDGEKVSNGKSGTELEHWGYALSREVFNG